MNINAVRTVTPSMVRRGLHALPTHRPHRRGRALRLVRRRLREGVEQDQGAPRPRREGARPPHERPRHRRRCGHDDAHPAPETLVRGGRRRPQGAQGRDGRDRRRARPGQAREGGAGGPPPLHDLHGGRRAAFRRLRAVQPLPRLRLVRRKARRVPQLPRADRYAHDDRELELGKPTNDITGRMGARRNVDVFELVLGGRVDDRVLARLLEEHPCRNPRLG